MTGRPKTLGPLLFLAVLGTGCQILNLDGEVEVRVRNESNRTFDEGVVYTYRDSITFADLGPGEQTTYKEIDRAYGIATTQVVMGLDTVRLQVIDYVGETPLKPGRYTYRLFFFEGDPRSLIVELLEDG